MKKLLLFMSLVVLSSCNHGRKITERNVISNAIVKLWSPLGGHGTGFYISPNEIISAKHVCIIPWVTTSDHSKIEKIVLDEYADLCYIKVSGGIPHSYFRLSYATLRLGDETCNAGYGQFGYTYNCGSITGMTRFREMGMLNWLYLSSQWAIPGMSGGPVFRGKYIVGVTAIQYRGRLGFVSNQQIKRFLGGINREDE